jgi:formylglycine-generating enzyme required for sulfatase activity
MRAETQAAKAVALTIRKGSIVAPLVLLLITIFLFVVYALPSDYPGLAGKFGLKVAKPTAKDILDAFGGLFSTDDPAGRDALRQSLGSKPWTFFTELLPALLKAYLEELVIEFRLILASVFGTVSVLALYSLIPGIAGLVYRRQFLLWFMASFALLLAIDNSGVFSSLAGNVQAMPSSGRFLIFLLSQLVLLVLAFRLRRETTSVSRIPAPYWNWALTGVLTLIGIALALTWSPLKTTDEAAASRAADERDAGKAATGWRDCETCPGLALLDKPYPAVAADAPPPAPFATLPGEPRLPPTFEQIRQKAAAQRRDMMKLVKPFYAGLYEVTHAEWDACTTSDSAACPQVKRPGAHSDRLPVAVSYAEAKAYAAWLSKQTGAVYRLASPIEWEYAARAGASFDWAWSHGNDVKALRKHAWFVESGGALHLVGLKEPNGYGLYDMHGNLAEWVNTCLGPDGAPKPGCSDNATHHETFGGQYRDMAQELRFGAALTTGGTAGIRLVREPGTAAPKLRPEPPPANARDKTAGEQRPIWALFTSGLSGWVFKWEFILVGLPLIYSLMRNSAAWTEPKRKNIVICLDGTSNTPDMVEQGFAATTNVYKMFRMLKSDPEGMFEPGEQFDASLCKRYRSGPAQQIAFYYAGVGNKYDNDPFLQTLGMAMGAGAGDIVERAYLDLVRVYQTGDRVFIVGFSRGAAIARLLARAIDARGAPRSVWTIRLFGKHRTLWASKTKQKVAIDVLGCWDTVGSFGVAKTIAGINFQQLNMGKDMSVPENVQQAYHMVALDEQRDSFEPTMMDPDPNRPERIVEVWFAGDHANIGGGWATDRLSDITLDFLLSRVSSGYAQSAERAGEDETWGIYLKAWKADKMEYWERQDDNPHIVDPDPLGQIQQWFSHLYQYRPRKMPQHAVISDTVFNRMVQSLPLYAPQALFNLNDELDKRRDLIDEQISKLKETSLLSADDLKSIEGYKAKLRLNRFEDYWNNKILPTRAGRFKLPAEALSNVAVTARAAAA